MRVVFMITPTPWLVRQKAQFPYGFLCLATALKEAGHDVVIVPWGHEEADAPDVLVFGGTTLEWPVVLAAAREAKERYPTSSLWYGGVHATVMTKDVVGAGVFDAVGVGEGDVMIVKMCQDLEAGRLAPLYGAPLIDDLGSLPIPDRTIPGIEPGGGIFAFDTKGPSVSVASSRGCYFACAFCGSDRMWGSSTRWRPVPDVIQEIKQSRCTQVKFLDDSLPANRRRLRELAAGLKSLGVQWLGSARCHDLTTETCELMYDAGCREMHVGVESADQRVLDCLKKKTTVKAQERGCRDATEAGIHVRALWMIGTPGEREDTPELNREFIERVPVAAHALAVFTPLPGTAIWNTPEEFGVTIVDRDYTHYNQYAWQRQNGDVKAATYRPLIRNRLLSLPQQQSNVRRMRNYLLNTGRMIQG